MKKFTLLAGMALVGASAFAQNFNVEDGTVKNFAERHGKGTYYNISMSEYSVEQLKKAGNTVVEIGPDDLTRYWYSWDETFAAGETGTPAPGYDFENMDLSYISLNVNAGWAGGGYNINKGYDVPATLSDQTVFHLCYASTAATPISPALIQILDLGNDGAFTLGSKKFDGAPILGEGATDDWQTIEFTLADFKKVSPTAVFDYTKIKGNYLVLLGTGSPVGANFSMDNGFFFTPEGEVAIETVEADVNAPVKYFNLQGVEVANPTEGLFIKVQGNKAEKVAL